MRASFKEKSSKFSVSKSQRAGVGNALSDLALDQATDGWSSMSSTFGDLPKLCKQHVEEIYNKLVSLDL